MSVAIKNQYFMCLFMVQVIDEQKAEVRMHLERAFEEGRCACEVAFVVGSDIAFDSEDFG